MITKDFVVVCDGCGKELSIDKDLQFGYSYTPAVIAFYGWGYVLDCEGDIVITLCHECTAMLVRSTERV